MPDYDALALEFTTTVKAILKQYYPLLMEQAYGDASAVLGADVAFDLANPYVQTVLDDLMTAAYLNDLGANLMAAGRQIISDGLAAGQSVDAIAAALQERGVAVSATKAEQIAHTETARAYSLGSKAAWRASGVVDRMQWITTDHACPICEPLHGKVVALDAEFAPGIAHPPESHVACRCALIPVLKD
ncbi:MAG TPA: minor capsid protein [Roseiflexaceae bacterium]|nr:minor capsid protein [Roseiflexaceae bacterium]